MMNDPPIVPPSLPSEGGQQYRLYFFNGSAHIHRVHEFEAKDDAAAIKLAESWREGRRIELWSRNRKVKTW